MLKKILVATNNAGKLERFQNLAESANLEVEFVTPASQDVESIEVIENGKTLAENAELKARAYFGKVDIPILANDAGFYVEGEGFIDAPKRKALGDAHEESLSKEQIAEKLLTFWQGIASKYGGRVDAAWIESFILIEANGSVKTAESVREVILTDEVFANAHIQMPVRALYISKATNKPAILHNEKEHLVEMEPVIIALQKLFA